MNLNNRLLALLVATMLTGTCSASNDDLLKQVQEDYKNFVQAVDDFAEKTANAAVMTRIGLDGCNSSEEKENLQASFRKTVLESVRKATDAAQPVCKNLNLLPGLITVDDPEQMVYVGILWSYCHPECEKRFMDEMGLAGLESQ